MRLTDDLAARRRLYAMPLITAPAVMVMDIPAHLAGPGLALERYYIVIIETDNERSEFDTFLTANRPALCPPDLLDRRPSCRETSAISFFEFVPPEAGWPWILLGHWPRDLARMVGADSGAFARGAYSMEAFTERDHLHASVKSHIARFGDAVTVRTVTPLTRTGGRA